MKRVTVVFDDEELYRAVKVEAARSGRTVKDVVAEAVRTWFGHSQTLTEERKARRRATLEELARFRQQQAPSGTNIVMEIHAMRDERLDAIESRLSTSTAKPSPSAPGPARDAPGGPMPQARHRLARTGVARRHSPSSMGS